MTSNRKEETFNFRLNKITNNRLFVKLRNLQEILGSLRNHDGNGNGNEQNNGYARAL